MSMYRICALVVKPRSAFRTAAVRSLSTTYKSSTGLAGLAVDLNGRENLMTISRKVLDEVKVLAAIIQNIL